MVFVNVKAPPERLPAELRPLLALMEDTLDGKVDEGKYPDAISQRILQQIQRTRLSPEENAKLKDEATWEAVQRNAYGVGRDEGKKLGLDEGRKLGLQQAILDLCEAYGIEVTEERKVALHNVEGQGLDDLRVALKTHRAWPTSGL